MIKVSFRTFTLVFLASMVVFVPAIHHSKTGSETRSTPIARSVGNTFPVAGQDEQPEPAKGIILKAPDFCEVGELVRLDATNSVVGGLTWQILPYTDDFEVIEGGTRAFFSSRTPGEYLVIIAGASEDTPFLQHHTLVVEGGEPPGPTTLTQKVSSWVRKVKDYDGKTAKAIALASVFRELAVKEDVKIDKMLEATAVSNTAVLGDDVDRWVPFLEALGAELDRYVENGELQTRADYRETWLAIARGIERTVPKEKLKKVE